MKNTNKLAPSLIIALILCVGAYFFVLKPNTSIKNVETVPDTIYDKFTLIVDVENKGMLTANFRTNILVDEVVYHHDLYKVPGNSIITREYDIDDLSTGSHKIGIEHVHAVKSDVTRVRDVTHELNIEILPKYCVNKITISPDVIYDEESFTISVDLENKGELEGKYGFLIYINDVAYLKAEVVMTRKSIKTVEYTVEDYTTGEYNIKIEDKEINIEIHELD